jgi:hypothetical protein
MIHFLFLAKDHLLEIIHIGPLVINEPTIASINSIRSFINEIHKERIEDRNCPQVIDNLQTASHQPYSSKDRNDILLDH